MTHINQIMRLFFNLLGNTLRNIYFIIIYISLVSVILCQNKKLPNNIKTNILKQYKTYPNMEIQDLYKFLHQSVMGSEHAVKDTIAVREWMKNEIANLDTLPINSLIDTLSPSGSIVRINLRPYIKSGYNPKLLLSAFIKTANTFRGSTELLEEYIIIVKKMIKKKELPFNLSKANIFFNKMKHLKYPAVHHSETYEKNYQPAYRVISSEYLQSLWTK